MLNLGEFDQLAQFKALNTEELKELAQVIDKRAYPKGEIIYSKNQDADHFYLIKQGEVEIGETTALKSSHIRLTLGPGAYLGGLPLLAEARHSNTVRVLTDCELLIFDRAGFEQLINRNPGCGLKIMRGIIIYLCLRIRKMSEKYTDMVDYMIDGEFYDSRHHMLMTGKRSATKKARELSPIKESELEGIPLFADFTAAEKKNIAHIMASCNYQAEEIIYEEHAKGGKLYIIKDGAVKISKRVQQHREVTLSTLEEGKFFGVLSLLEETEHTATTEAIKDSRILVIEKPAFEEFIKQAPACGIKMLSYICQNVYRLLSKIEQDYDYTSNYVWESGPYYL